MGDPILNRKCRPVGELTDRYKVLIDDMFETMYHNDGVGLAAPQVGVLRRIFVVDVGDVDEEGADKPVSERTREPYVFINPEILETSGEQIGSEGCLSVPDKVANVKRPNYVKIKALDRDMNEFIYEGEGIRARAVLHEYDHLDGILYPEIAEGPLMDIDDVIEEDAESAPPKGRKHISRGKRVKHK